MRDITSENYKKWKNAQLLISAKKSVDSLLFYSEHAHAMHNFKLEEKTEEIKCNVYLKCAMLLDAFIKEKDMNKKAITSEDAIVDNIYRIRDQHCAHRDKKYKAEKYETFSKMAEAVKNELIHVRKVCASILPESITLDFVPHDYDGFRVLHGLSPEKESEVERRKYPLAEFEKMVAGERSYEIIRNSEQLEDMTKEEISNACVVMKDGICYQEGLQNRQDAVILANLAYETNIWCTIVPEALAAFNELTKIGVYDEYGIPRYPDPNDTEQQKRILDIFETIPETVAPEFKELAKIARGGVC